MAELRSFETTSSSEGDTAEGATTKNSKGENQLKNSLDGAGSSEGSSDSLNIFPGVYSIHSSSSDCDLVEEEDDEDESDNEEVRGQGGEQMFNYREIDYEELQIEHKIGAGAFGAVYQVYSYSLFGFIPCLPISIYFYSLIGYVAGCTCR